MAGRALRRSRSMRLLRAMVKIQVAAEARLRSKLAALRHTMISASWATSCAVSASVPPRMMKAFTRGA